MFRPNFQRKLTLAFFVLASAFILLAEPAFAQKSRSNKKSGGSSETKQQSSQSQSAPAPKAQQSSSSSNSRSSSSSSSRTSQPSGSSASRSASQNNSTRTTSTGQSGRSSTTVTSSRSTTSRFTNSNTSGINSSTRTSSGVSQPSNSSSNNQTSTRRSRVINTRSSRPSIVVQGPSVSSNNRISSNISRDIVSIIGKSSSTRITRQQDPGNRTSPNTSTSTTPPSNVAQQPAGSSDNRISSRDRANSRIGSVISPGRTPPPNAAQRPAAGLNDRTNSRGNTTIGNYIGRQSTTTIRTRKRTSTDTGNREDSHIGGIIGNNRSSTPVIGGSDRGREFVSGPRITNETTSGRANRKAEPQTQTTIINRPSLNIVERPKSTRDHHFEPSRRSHLVYRDRPYLRQNHYRFDHTYIDNLHQIRHKTIWPRYSFVIRYNRGPRFSYWHFYPYYHRKYVFVSLGGYWPSYYRYTRYYWYGCHLYDWYGYYPIAREIQGDTYNYYTYNYYYDDNPQTYATDQIYDNTGNSDEGPAQSTLADIYFDEAVQAFENGDYEKAIDKFAQAMEVAPDDFVLPFAYCQALLASGRYTKAAEILRTVLVKIGPENEGIFYPRGLYPDEETLLSQLDNLAEKAELYSFDADLQLLLGYQLLGIGQHDKAETALIKASLDLKNANAAAVLLRLLEKLKTTDNIDTQEAQFKKIQSKNNGTSPIPFQSNVTNKGHEATIKGTVVVATLCVLAGSTGIGHYLRIC